MPLITEWYFEDCILILYKPLIHVNARKSFSRIIKNPNLNGAVIKNATLQNVHIEGATKLWALVYLWLFASDNMMPNTCKINTLPSSIESCVRSYWGFRNKLCYMYLGKSCVSLIVILFCMSIFVFSFFVLHHFWRVWARRTGTEWRTAQR